MTNLRCGQRPRLHTPSQKQYDALWRRALPVFYALASIISTPAFYITRWPAKTKAEALGSAHSAAGWRTRLLSELIKRKGDAPRILWRCDMRVMSAWQPPRGVNSQLPTVHSTLCIREGLSFRSLRCRPKVVRGTVAELIMFSSLCILPVTALRQLCSLSLLLLCLL